MIIAKTGFTVPTPEKGPSKQGETPQLQRHEAAAIFEALDEAGNGCVTHAEFVQGLRVNHVLAEVLNVPTRMMQERHIRLVFEAIDTDGSGGLDMQEFLSYYCPGELIPKPQVGSHDPFLRSSHRASSPCLSSANVANNALPILLTRCGPSTGTYDTLSPAKPPGPPTPAEAGAAKPPRVYAAFPVPYPSYAPVAAEHSQSAPVGTVLAAGTPGKAGEELRAAGKPPEREFFIDNLLVRIHFIIDMILVDRPFAPWEFEFPFPGSLIFTFLGQAPTSVSLLATPGEGRWTPPQFSVASPLALPQENWAGPK